MSKRRSKHIKCISFDSEHGGRITLIVNTATNRYHNFPMSDKVRQEVIEDMRTDGSGLLWDVPTLWQQQINVWSPMTNVVHHLIG